MSDKKQILIYIISIITFLIIAIAAASYAYFASQTDSTNANFNVQTQTAGATAFTAYSSGAISLDATAEKMRDDNISTVAVDKANATIFIKVENDNEDLTSVCNYDIIWVWDSDDIYTSSSVTLPYTGWDDNIYPFEMSVSLTDNTTGQKKRERDLSVLNWNDKNAAIIANESIIATGKKSEKSYTIEVSIYNIPIDQLVFYDKFFQGHIEVRNNACVSNKKDDSAVFMAEYIKNKYADDGINNLYYHDGGGIYTQYPLEAADYSYRYAGADPNNYVCFKDDNCDDENNLFRIIGVFNGKVKLISNDRTLLLPWQTGDNNDWSSASVNNYLNGEYLNSLGSKTNMIVSNIWQTSGLPWVDGLGKQENTAKDIYKLEIIKSGNNYNSKIALMYVNDYEYAALPEYWHLPGFQSSKEDYRQSAGNNWLLNEQDATWTISKNVDVTDRVFRIGIDGAIGRGGENSMKENKGVRPVFFLSPVTKYISGTGSLQDPFIIDI